MEEEINIETKNQANRGELKENFGDVAVKNDEPTRRKVSEDRSGEVKVQQ